MLTPKQEVLCRLTAAYIRSGAHNSLLSSVNARNELDTIRGIARDVIDFGDDAPSKALLDPKTPIGELEFSQRARSAIVGVMQGNGLGDKWDGNVENSPAAFVAQYVDERTLTARKNVGVTTLREIKRQFGLCGIVLRMKAPSVSAANLYSED